VSAFDDRPRNGVDHVEALDLLINNAGLALYDDLSDRAVLDQHLAVNLFGMYGVTRAFLPLLTRSRGAIVNVLSISALAAWPVLPTYSRCVDPVTSASSVTQIGPHHARSRRN
jgi:NAD(P)-dependent dehydrogenase (short-subunit alcohol dehydrogenase family)